MKNDMLDKALRLSKRTNTPFIFMNEDGEVGVIMSAEAYELLIDFNNGIDFDEVSENDEYDIGEQLENDILSTKKDHFEVPETDRDAVGTKDKIPNETEDETEEQFYLEPIE